MLNNNNYNNNNNNNDNNNDNNNNIIMYYFLSTIMHWHFDRMYELKHIEYNVCGATFLLKRKYVIYITVRVGRLRRLTMRLVVVCPP